MGIKKEVRDLARATHVLEVAVKYGLGYLIEEAGLKWHLPVHHKVSNKKFKEPLTPEKKLREAFEELGATYVKLGQLLSIRPDLIDQKFCDELKKLQDKVKPFSYLDVKKVVEAELKKPINKIFKKFDIIPIAAASIGQVHKAVLKDGTVVAVKVQRPKVDKLMETDIDIMYYFAHHYDKKHGDKLLSGTRIVDEFKEYTEQELNYLHEASNANTFRKHFEGSKTVVIPKVYSDYSTKKVLTMEYIDGDRLSDLLRLKKKFNRKKVIENIANAIMKQIYLDGFFHADLHPGNLIILKGNKIAFLDFGIVGEINEVMKKRVVDMLVALVGRDIDKVSVLMTKIGERTPQTNMEKYKREIENILGSWHDGSLADVKVSHILHLLFDATIQNNIRMPEFLVLYGKAFLTLEATGHILYPEFNAVNYVEPYVRKVVKRRYSPKNVLHDFIKKTRRAAEIIEDIPKDTKEVLEQLKSGSFKIDIADSDIDRLGMDIDTSSNRMAFGMVSAAFVIAGAMLFTVNVGPKYGELPAISLLMFGIAVIFLLFLLQSILKEGRR